MKFRKIMAQVLLLAGSVSLLITGCFRVPESTQTPTQRRLVTQITVRQIHPEEPSHQMYLDQDKMNHMLLYLRRLDPRKPVQIDQEHEDDASYEITVHYSDGSLTVYRQKGDNYLSVDDGPWMRIDPAVGIQLSQILDALPGD